MVQRIDELTEEQKAQLPGWAEKWIKIGLTTGEMNFPRFCEGAEECYGFAKIPWPGIVVRVSSPLALSISAPLSALLIEMAEKNSRKTLNVQSVHEVCEAVVTQKVVGGDMRSEVLASVKRAVFETVNSATKGKGSFDVQEAIKAAPDAIRKGWTSYIGGQFWAGGWYWGAAIVSFFRDVCHLELPGDTWDRAMANQKTIESACWWYPHTRFVMVSERPSEIHLEKVENEQGTQHRLHHDSRAAVSWPDRWGVWASHGTRVPQHVIEKPETITIQEIENETNIEVRRVMQEKIGWERYILESGAKLLHTDEFGALYQKTFEDDETLTMVHVTNGSLEPDGSRRKFMLMVHPELRPLLSDGSLGEPQEMTARAAVASTYGLRAEDYEPYVRT